MTDAKPRLWASLSTVTLVSRFIFPRKPESYACRTHDIDSYLGQGISFFKKNIIYLPFLAALGLFAAPGAFSSRGEQGPSWAAVYLVWVSRCRGPLVAEPRLQGVWAAVPRDLSS